MQRNLKCVVNAWMETTCTNLAHATHSLHTRFILMLATCNAYMYRARSHNREHVHTLSRESGERTTYKLGVRVSL
jgi:hypothetical protein